MIHIWLLAYDEFMLLPTLPYVANALGSDSCSLALVVTDSIGSGFIATKVPPDLSHRGQYIQVQNTPGG